MRPFLLPEVPVWASEELLSRSERPRGGSGGLEVRSQPEFGSPQSAQLRDYLGATGAKRGILAFRSLGEISWVENPAFLLAPSPEKGEAVHEGRSS